MYYLCTLLVGLYEHVNESLGSIKQGISGTFVSWWFK
jgi:hypothetical protein